MSSLVIILKIIKIIQSIFFVSSRKALLLSFIQKCLTRTSMLSSSSMFNNKHYIRMLNLLLNRTTPTLSYLQIKAIILLRMIKDSILLKIIIITTMLTRVRITINHNRCHRMILMLNSNNIRPNSSNSSMNNRMYKATIMCNQGLD